MKKYLKVIGFVVALIVFIGLPKLIEPKENQVIVEKITMPELIKIELKGAVHMPGLYEVEKGTTYQALFNYALGVTEYANLEGISLYDEIHEDIVITVYEKTEVITQKININQASLETLMTLPNIGEVTANKIIDYRTKNGSFTSIDEIMEVSGIGVQTFEKLKNLITI